MSLSSENMMKLMAYADGELEGAERTEAELLLVQDADALSFIEQIAGLGELVELGHEARLGKAIASFDVADAVMARTVNEKTEETEKPSIVRSLDAAREKKKGSGLRIGAVAAALALAASVFVFARHHAEETPMATVQPVPANAVPGTGVAVESAGNSVSVFYLPTANELSTSVVVWVDETGEK